MPFPDAWLSFLERVGHYHLLSSDEQKRLRGALRIFLAEKEFEGCGGLELTDEIRVTIAGLASVMVLGFNGFYFDNVQSILVYPTAFAAPQQKPLAGDVVLETQSENLGEAHHRGPVILSWEDVREHAQEPGHGENLVFHEFAHQLDMLNGAFDGVPRLPAELQASWERIMGREFKRLQKAAAHGQEPLIDPYGAENPSEFFAVVSECFFDAPWQMQREYGELYALMRDYYQQDPAHWAPITVP
ncbi:MAG: zinc-dependent peptidase [Planctomycetes bacterium]|nr:zinc-dependent peptidase [Planctomycetota bacterium]